MHPAIRYTAGNLIVLQRRTLDEMLDEVDQAIDRDEAKRRAANPSQYATAWELLSIAARCAIGVIVGYGAVQLVTLLVMGEG